MPLRTDLPSALNLSRRAAAPVKLPRMMFPMAGAPADGAGGPAPEGFEVPEAQPDAEMAAQAPQGYPGQYAGQGFQPQGPTASPVPAPVSDAAPVPVAPTAERVIVFGRSNCPACLEAVQDLIDRQVSFTYLDVVRDPQALEHLQAICGGSPVVPVIIHIGFRGT